MVLLSKFLRKQRQIWASEHHFGEVRSDALPWWMARWKIHGRLCIRVNWTIFRYLLRFRSYEAKCVQLGCFHRVVALFALNFHLDRVIPHQPFLASENTETLCYPVVKTVFFCFPSFWHNTGVWQTDGQTGGYATHSMLQRLQTSFAVCCNKNDKSSRVNFNRNKNNTHWPCYVRITITNHWGCKFFGNLIFSEISGNINKSQEVIMSIIFIRIR